jgi:hypothetical protein
MAKKAVAKTDLMQALREVRQSIAGPSQKKEDGRLPANDSIAVMEAIQRGEPVVVRAGNGGQLKLDGKTYLIGQEVTLEPGLRNLASLIDHGYFILKSQSDAAMAARGRKDYYREQLEPLEVYLLTCKTDLAKKQAEYAQYMQGAGRIGSEMSALESTIEQTEKALLEKLAAL